MTFATLFGGFGIADLGYHAAGFTSAWGVEYDDAIAAVARANGLPMMTADVLDRPWRTLGPVDALHMSPPCPSFSAAKVGGEETDNDRALAAACADAVRDLRPAIVTVENVPAYAKSKSWATIAAALDAEGYGVAWRVLNAADYGVPQSRRRFIAVALRGVDRRAVTLPAPTHAKGGERAGLFGAGRLPWVGWLEAVSDILHTFPASALAPWQVKRLPEAMRTVLVGAGGFDGGIVTVEPGDPAFTVTANTNQASQVRAVLVDGKANDFGRSVTHVCQGEPAFAVTASAHKQLPRAVLPARVVQVTPRGLARFQSIPDDYALPASKALACRGIGNAVPARLMQAVAAHALALAERHGILAPAYA